MARSRALKLGPIGSAAAMLVALDGTAARAESFGPQSWSDGSTTGRYRRVAGNHNISATDCGGSVVIELRVDVIDEPDIGYGNRTYTCGTARTTYSAIDSRNSAHRGHFMQSRSNWYGTMNDKA